MGKTADGSVIPVKIPLSLLCCAHPNCDMTAKYAVYDSKCRLRGMYCEEHANVKVSLLERNV